MVPSTLVVAYKYQKESPSHGYRRASPFRQGGLPATAGFFIAKALSNHATIAWFLYYKKKNPLKRVLSK